MPALVLEGYECDTTSATCSGEDPMSITLNQNVCSSELGPDTTALPRSAPPVMLLLDNLRRISFVRVLPLIPHSGYSNQKQER